ncbi:MAG: cytochrome c oxidase subunit II [Sulfurifustaceae bacterium]
MIDLGHLPAASDYAESVDTLFYAFTAVCAVVVIGVFVVLTVFAVRYRRTNDVARGPVRRTRPIEWIWIIVPFAIFFAVFVWGADLYYVRFSDPPDALDIYVLGKQWMWKVEHPQGRREIDELHVPAGRSIRLIITSQDVIHSFFLPGFRLKQDAVPGRYATLWFRARAPGDHRLFCAEYCGTDHARMRGRLVVMPPAEYEQWLRGGNAEPGLAARGAQRFREFGCSGCHGENSAVRCPRLQGLYGRPVPLAGGGTVTFDERYIRDSILLPKKEIAAGYEPIMPSFAGQIDEEQILEIIAYLKSLKPEDRIEP